MATKQQGHPITSARRMGAKQTNPLPLQDDHDEGHAAANLASRHDLAMHVEAQTPGFASCGKSQPRSHNCDPFLVDRALLQPLCIQHPTSREGSRA
jgi:hypothetical protein